MSARRKGTVLSLAALSLVGAWALMQSACGSDTSGTGDDCDPSVAPCVDEDSGEGGDSSRLDAHPDAPAIDSTPPVDSTLGDVGTDTTDAGTDTTPSDAPDVGTDTTDAGTDTKDATTVDATDAADARDAGDASDAADARDASDATDAADTRPDGSDATDARDAADTADAGPDTGGDSGLASDPFHVRCRSGTSCDRIEGDVCCTPKPDGGVASPWRCWDSFTCVAGTGMECDETADCAGAFKCCASSTSATASTCKASCTSSEITLCMTNAECGSGKTCAAFSHVSGATLGSCTP